MPDETTPLHNDDEDRAEKMLGVAPLEGTPNPEKFLLDYCKSTSMRLNFTEIVEVMRLFAALVSKDSREELDAQMEIVRTLKDDNVKMYEQLEQAESRIKELQKEMELHYSYCRKGPSSN